MVTAPASGEISAVQIDTKTKAIIEPKPMKDTAEPYLVDDQEMVTAPASGEMSAMKIDTKAEVKFGLMPIKETPEHKPCLVDDVKE